MDEDNFLWSGGQIRYTSGGEWIDLTGGEMAHLGRTSPEPGPPKSYKTVQVNLVTPFDKTFTLTLSPAQ